MKAEHLTDATLPDGGPVVNRDPNETVADAALKAARATTSVNGEPCQVEVMKFMLTHKANMKSRHNQQEGMKKSRDKAYQIKDFTPREKIEAMRDLALDLVGAEAQGTLARDLGWISQSMDLLVPNWASTRSTEWALSKMRVKPTSGVEGTAVPKERAKEATLQVAVLEDQKGPVEVMPLGLPLNEAIVWQVRHGEHRHYYIAAECKVSQPEVACRMSAMVNNGLLTLIENPRRYTYEVVEVAA
jgi:hypothetical protein